MASRAHHPGDSVSAARITAYSGVGVALIGAIAAIITGVSHDNGNGIPTGPTPTIISHPKLTRVSNQGSVDKVEINGSGTEVTVTGSAAEDVDSVAVMIGPRKSGGQYWANVGNVSNQQWKLTIATDPHLPDPYTVEARYHSVGGGAASESAFKFIFQGTDPTTPPPPSPTNQIVNCAEQLGPNCFNGPGWGPPSVYQSNQ
jgi:hypothetical protein